MSPPVVLQSIREQIANRLRSEVLSGHFAEGEPLREAQLAERFGVSRGPIRDALLLLTQEGVLVAQRNSGVRVGSGPSREIQPLVVSLRRQIETQALTMIFDRLSSEDDARWKTQLERLREACEAGDLPAAIELDIAFHRSIVERTGDADLVSIWLPIITRMLLRYSRHKKLMDVYREHAKVVKAIKARNKAAALAALEANIV